MLLLMIHRAVLPEKLLISICQTIIGVGLTDIVSTTGTAHTIHTSIDHGLNRIVSISTVTAGAGYGSGSAGDIYNARLVGIGTSVTGVNATAKITVDGSGTITAVKIMDGGSSYGIGNTMAIVGIPTFAPFTQAVVQVDKIYDNVGDSVRVLGITSAAYSGYNNLYRITEVGSQGNSLTVESSNTISGFVTTESVLLRLHQHLHIQQANQLLQHHTHMTLQLVLLRLLRKIIMVLQ